MRNCKETAQEPCETVWKIRTASKQALTGTVYKRANSVLETRCRTTTVQTIRNAETLKTCRNHVESKETTNDPEKNGNRCALHRKFKKPVLEIAENLYGQAKCLSWTECGRCGPQGVDGTCTVDWVMAVVCLQSQRRRGKSPLHIVKQKETVAFCTLRKPNILKTLKMLLTVAFTFPREQEDRTDWQLERWKTLVL